MLMFVLMLLFLLPRGGNRRIRVLVVFMVVPEDALPRHVIFERVGQRPTSPAPWSVTMAFGQTKNCNQIPGAMPQATVVVGLRPLRKCRVGMLVGDDEHD